MKINSLSILFFSFLFLVSCRKERETIIKEVPVVHSWSLDSSLFSYNKILFTSIPINDSVLAVANSQIITYINLNQLNKGVNSTFINFNPVYGFLAAPSITKTIGVTLLDSNRLKVFSTTSPISNNGNFIFTPAYTNAIFSVKGFPLSSFPHSGYPIINSKYILAPTEIDYQAEKAYLSLLQVNVSHEPFSKPDDNSVSLVSSKAITLTPESSTIGFAEENYFSAAYYNKFFLYYSDQFYRIDTLGNVKAFGSSPVQGVSNGPVEQMFTINNYLFAIGGSKFFVSQDEGETWTLFSDVQRTVYGSLTYLNVGNDLYAVFQSQIFKVTLKGNDLNYQELDNGGLETSQITSINITGKYAFITTLSGLYYRDKDSINSPKK